jgi:hypothetical protein
MKQVKLRLPLKKKIINLQILVKSHSYGYFYSQIIILNIVLHKLHMVNWIYFVPIIILYIVIYDLKPYIAVYGL